MRLPDDIMEMKAERLEFSEIKVSKTVLGFKPTGILHFKIIAVR